MKKIILFLLVSLLFVANVNAQTPQHYNYQNGNQSWYIPFAASGKAANWLFLAGDFNQPTPCPSGQQITRVYFYVSSPGKGRFVNLHVLMAQDSITTLNPGAFYLGPWDTVYYHAYDSLNGLLHEWVSITLDTPYPYNPAKSLIIFVGQCACFGNGFFISNSTLANIRRVYADFGCPFTPYAGDGMTANFGIDVEPAVGVSNNNNIPGIYRLEQNYPNPFNPVTQISYSIPKAGNVKLAVYDVLGREIATLVNEVKTPGRYSVKFDAANFVSGVYMYKIEAGSFTAAKKMMLIK